MLNRNLSTIGMKIIRLSQLNMGLNMQIKNVPHRKYCLSCQSIKVGADHQNQVPHKWT